MRHALGVSKSDMRPGRKLDIRRRWESAWGWPSNQQVASMTVSSTTYLVTGATRGIGAEITAQLSANPANTVIAAVMDINEVEVQDLISKRQENVTVIQINSKNENDALNAAKLLTAQGKIDHIDVIIAVAGIAPVVKPMVQVGLQEFQNTIDVNVAGPLLLFQAFYPFLEKSTNPRFLAVSSLVGSITLQDYIPYQAGLYGTSKAALNFIIHRLSREHPNITSLILHPGLVVTAMAAETQRQMGKNIQDTLREGRAITVQHSASSIIELAEKATKDYSGKLWDAPEKRQLPF
jgi:norsolorinic acid ketoreductase